MKRAALFLTSIVLVCAMGCKTVTAPPAPLVTGAVNPFDQDTYKALMAAQATLNSLNASYHANPTQLASLKAPLDQAATDYNAAMVLWQTYHAAAVAGQATAAQQSAASNGLAKIQADVSSIKVTP